MPTHHQQGLTRQWASRASCRQLGTTVPAWPGSESHPWSKEFQGHWGWRAVPAMAHEWATLCTWLVVGSTSEVCEWGSVPSVSPGNGTEGAQVLRETLRRGQKKAFVLGHITPQNPHPAQSPGTCKTCIPRAAWIGVWGGLCSRSPHPSSWIPGIRTPEGFPCDPCVPRDKHHPGPAIPTWAPSAARPQPQPPPASSVP